MPTSVPRMSVTQATRGPEGPRRRAPLVPRGPAPVVGKAGRAETATDPSPLDMIETIINLRDRDVWPKRKLRFADAERQTQAALASLEAKGLLKAAPASDRESLVNDAAMAGVEPGGRHAPRPGPAPARRVPPRPRPPTRRRGGRLPPRSRRPAARPSRRSTAAERKELARGARVDARRPARPRAQVRRRDGPGQGRLAPARRPGRAPRRPRRSSPRPRAPWSRPPTPRATSSGSRTRPSSRGSPRGSSRRTRPRSRSGSEDAQLGALRPRRGGRHLVRARGADEARRPTASSRLGPRPRRSCKPSAPRWRSRSRTGSSSGRRRRRTS